MLVSNKGTNQSWKNTKHLKTPCQMKMSNTKGSIVYDPICIKSRKCQLNCRSRKHPGSHVGAGCGGGGLCRGCSGILHFKKLNELDLSHSDFFITHLEACLAPGKWTINVTSWKFTHCMPGSCQPHSSDKSLLLWAASRWRNSAVCSLWSKSASSSSPS